MYSKYVHWNHQHSAIHTSVFCLKQDWHMKPDRGVWAEEAMLWLWLSGTYWRTCTVSNPQLNVSHFCPIGNLFVDWECKWKSLSCYLWDLTKSGKKNDSGLKAISLSEPLFLVQLDVSISQLFLAKARFVFDLASGFPETSI